jgi:hypothetical protein
MSIVLLGSTSGSITLQEPAVAGTNTVNFGANTGVAILDANTPAFRNRIINGAMVINQRATSITATDYSVDRFQYVATVSAKATISQDTSVYPTGFRTSLKAKSICFKTGTVAVYKDIDLVSQLFKNY